MSRSSWGRPRGNEMIQDLQALAFWLVLIGVIGYLLFPSFFQDLFGRLKMPLDTPTQATQTTDLLSQGLVSPDFPLVFQEVYGSGQLAELSKGYWAIFVREGQFEQMELTEEAYSFLLGLIEKDRNNGRQKVILSANGQVRQVLLSDEVYDIMSQLSVVGSRNRSP